MKNKLFLLMGLALMCNVTSGFASAPSYSNKDGTQKGQAKMSPAGGSETFYLTAPESFDIACISLEQVAEKPYSWTKVEPISIVRLDRGYAYHRGTGAGYRKRSESNIVIPRCRTFEC